MRNEQALIKLLRGLVDLLADEARNNPQFAARLDEILKDPKVKPETPKLPQPQMLPELPDIHSEWNRLSESEFRLWLRGQSIPVLRALIRVNDLDATRRTAKWKEAEKLSEFIINGLKARYARGSSFLGRSM